MKIPESIAKIRENNAWQLCEIDHDRDKKSYRFGFDEGFTLAMERAEKLIFALIKIEEAERMGYGIHLTYGQVARNALEEWAKDMK